MKKKTPFLVLFLLLTIAAALGIYRHLSEKTKFNETYVNGNVAGNLYNSGLFCENDGTIFFSNPADENKLYSMNSDGSNVKKLCDDTALSINADANYVYYVRNNQKKDPDTAFSFLNINTNSLCRIRRTGGDSVKILDSSRCSDASLIICVPTRTIPPFFPRYGLTARMLPLSPQKRFFPVIPMDSISTITD